MGDLLIIDGVRYEPWTPSKEDEFEGVVSEHIKDIFGGDAFYFNIKQKLTSISGKGSIPDGLLIDFKSKEFYLIELEISTHDAYTHIAYQLMRFINAIKNDLNRRKLRDVLYDEINNNPILKEKVKAIVGGEIYKSLTDIITKPILVVLIDEITEELKEACEALNNPTKVVEFKTYTRERIGLAVHAHLFEPFYRPLISEIKSKPRLIRVKRGKRTPDREYRLPILETLIEMSGRGKTKDIVDRVGEKMKDILTDFDYETLPSGSDIRWRNAVEWERKNMVDEGLLKRDSPRGIWEITDKGKKHYYNRTSKK